MKIKSFIDRPILSGVISALIVMVGVISLIQLPVEQFPEIAPPTVSVSTSYSGANAETVLKSVVVPLEEAINGVEDMMYMVSTATNNGSANIQIYFRQGTDGDMAMVNVQNRIASAQGLLPAELMCASARQVALKPWHFILLTILLMINFLIITSKSILNPVCRVLAEWERSM